MKRAGYVPAHTRGCPRTVLSNVLLGCTLIACQRTRNTEHITVGEIFAFKLRVVRCNRTKCNEIKRGI